MFNHLSLSHKGMALAFIGFTAFAFGDVVSKTLTANYSVIQIVFVNHALAALYLLALLHKTEGVQILKRRHKLPLHLFRGVLNTAIALSVIFSFSILPIADVYTFIFTVPLFSALLALGLYRQKICLNRMIAILIGFAGVIVGLQPGSAGFDLRLCVPILAGFLIALKFTISKSLEGENTILLGLWPVLISSLIAGSLSIGIFEPITWPHMGLYMISAFTTSVGLVCVSQAFRIAPAAAVSPFLYTEMIWAIIFGYLIFGDMPSGMMLAGAGIIILSGFYLIETERKTRQKNKSAQP